MDILLWANSIYLMGSDMEKNRKLSLCYEINIAQVI